MLKLSLLLLWSLLLLFRFCYYYYFIIIIKQNWQNCGILCCTKTAPLLRVILLNSTVRCTFLAMYFIKSYWFSSLNYTSYILLSIVFFFNSTIWLYYANLNLCKRSDLQKTFDYKNYDSMILKIIVWFVYVVGLKAVQFENNWVRKNLRTANLAVQGIFLIQLFPNWTSV